MSQDKIDLTTFFINILDKGEWEIVIFSLLLTYSITYVFKIIYFMVVREEHEHPNHIRLIAIVAGLLAAANLWHDHSLGMEWYTAVLVIGFLSIVLHPILHGVVNMKVVEAKVPFLSKLLKGSLK